MTSFAADRARRTTQVDRWLAELLGAEPDVALVAVGGYGRRELLPRSDLDVLLLHGGRDDIAGNADRTPFSGGLMSALPGHGAVWTPPSPSDPPQARGTSDEGRQRLVVARQLARETQP